MTLFCLVNFFFIKNWFILLNKNLKPNIPFNSVTTEGINIEQKQGDALPCSLFILCMDPLIRKVNGGNEIEGLNTEIMGKQPLAHYNGITLVTLI